jgi:hypothetical protein
MKKIVLISLAAISLAGCTAREQQLLAAGAVGAVAGGIVASEMSQPRPVYVERRPVVEERYVPLPPRRPRCYMVYRQTQYGTRHEEVCN